MGRVCDNTLERGNGADDRSVADMALGVALGAINSGLAVSAEKVEGGEDVGQYGGNRSTVKAEAYLLEHKPEGFKRSARAGAERKQLRL